MKGLKTSIGNLSIATRLYFVVGIMAGLIAAELIVLYFAMETLSAARAFVGGESLWSKSQKNAVLSLRRYAATQDPLDYQSFLHYLKVPEGDSRARIELQKPRPDMARVYEGFEAGQIHRDDIPLMIKLLRRFSWVSYIDQAVRIWSQADGLFLQMKTAGEQYHLAVSQSPIDYYRAGAMMGQVERLNNELTPLQEQFSSALGEGSRWLEHLVLSLLLAAVLTVETIGLTLTYLTSRHISKGLKELLEAARSVGKGDFSRRLPIRSNDELGKLSASVNQMAEMLSGTYAELEARVQDRTQELTQLADENHRLYEEASEALKTREIFLSVASHELRTPFTSLYLQLQMLERRVKKTEGDPEVRDFARDLLSQARRYAALLDQLLDLTRLEIGKFQLSKQRMDLASLVSASVSQLQADAAARRVLLEIETQPVPGNFDPTRIGQLATNLVSNAIKYGEGRPVNVSVWSEGERGFFSVRDHGMGISEEKRPMIFRRFERCNDDPNVAGLGLGLYISKQIVEAHGGELRVESELGQGSLFTAEFHCGEADVVAS